MNIFEKLANELDTYAAYDPGTYVMHANAENANPRFNFNGYSGSWNERGPLDKSGFLRYLNSLHGDASVDPAKLNEVIQRVSTTAFRPNLGVAANLLQYLDIPIKFTGWNTNRIQAQLSGLARSPEVTGEVHDYFNERANQYRSTALRGMIDQDPGAAFQVMLHHLFSRFGLEEQANKWFDSALDRLHAGGLLHTLNLPTDVPPDESLRFVQNLVGDDAFSDNSWRTNSDLLKERIQTFLSNSSSEGTAYGTTLAAGLTEGSPLLQRVTEITQGLQNNAANISETTRAELSTGREIRPSEFAGRVSSGLIRILSEPPAAASNNSLSPATSAVARASEADLSHDTITPGLTSILEGAGTENTGVLHKPFTNILHFLNDNIFSRDSAPDTPEPASTTL